MTCRTASASSRIPLILAMATGVGYRGPEQRDVIPLRCLKQFDRRVPTARDQHARDVVAERGGQHVHSRGRIEALEIPHFALAEHEDAGRLQIFVEPGERKPGLLNVWAGDDPLESGIAAEQFDRKTHRVGSTLQQARHRHRGCHRVNAQCAMRNAGCLHPARHRSRRAASIGHRASSHASGSMSPSFPSARRNSTVTASLDEFLNTITASLPSPSSAAASSIVIGFAARLRTRTTRGCRPAPSPSARGRASPKPRPPRSGLGAADDTLAAEIRCRLPSSHFPFSFRACWLILPSA